MTAYDRIAYPSAPLPRTHPHHLGGLALQLGFDIATQQRVLDIGCGAGRNLTWIAATLPHAQCLGVDLAASAITSAGAFAQELQLENIHFEAADFSDTPKGEFDFIIANGLYSWIPVAARARLLKFIEERLAPQGIAMVSFHDEHRPWRPSLLAIADLDERLRSAKAAHPELNDFDDGLLLHDALAETSDPITLEDFTAALPSGLQYLCDARGADAAPDFHEAVVIHSGRTSAAVKAKLWYVTRDSFPATVDTPDGAIVAVLSAPRPLVAQPGEYPKAWPPAQKLIADELMSFFGALVELDADDRAILRQLDGTRNASLFPEETLRFFARAGLLIA